jgi:hypothetical protein
MESRDQESEFATPLFSVSVASKGLSVSVSALESTDAGWSASDDSEGVSRPRFAVHDESSGGVEVVLRLSIG